MVSVSVNVSDHGSVVSAPICDSDIVWCTVEESEIGTARTNRRT